MSLIEIREVLDPNLGFKRPVRFIKDLEFFHGTPQPSFREPGTEIEDIIQWHLAQIDAKRKASGYGPEDEFNVDINDFSHVTVAGTQFEDFMQMLTLAIRTYQDAEEDLSQNNTTALVGGAPLDAFGARFIAEAISMTAQKMLENLMHSEDVVMELAYTYYVLRASLAENQKLGPGNYVPANVKHPYSLTCIIYLEIMDAYFLSVGFDHFRVTSDQFLILNSVRG
ncbi:MAG: hypothetical protein H9W81_08395 [Enterococcus sp.]|nr:hypothetical protein [Enterococcus sp.]